MTSIPRSENPARAEVCKILWEIWMQELSALGAIQSPQSLEILILSTSSATDVLEAMRETRTREARLKPHCLFVNRNDDALEAIRKKAASYDLSDAITTVVGDGTDPSTVARLMQDFRPHVVEMLGLSGEIPGDPVRLFEIVRRGLQVNGVFLTSHAGPMSFLRDSLIAAGFAPEVNQRPGSIYAVAVCKAGMLDIQTKRSTTRDQMLPEIRLAETRDLKDIMAVEAATFGFDPDAMATEELMRRRIALCNSNRPGWFWVAEHRGRVVADLVLQPTNLEPDEIISWSFATDDGTLEKTFDAEGRNLFVVSFASADTDVGPLATALLGHRGLRLWLSERKRAMMFCSRMPGFLSAHERTGIPPEEYWRATKADGTPKDGMLSQFSEFVASLPYKLLRDGYPPDKDSGGHGVLFAAIDPVKAIDDMAMRISEATLASKLVRRKHVTVAHGS